MSVDEQGLLLGMISTISGILIFLSEIPGSWIIDRLTSWLKVDPLIWRVHLKRIWGFIWLGVLPLLVILILDQGVSHGYGLLNIGSLPTWMLVMALSALIIVVNFFNSQSKSNLGRYPEIKLNKWSVYSILSSGVTWILYLIAYEFLFRGILLFSSMQLLQPITAITLNITIYSLFHLQKGQKEIIASIPFGIILCLLTIKSQSIWPAIFLHNILALSNEWLSIYFKSEKTLKSKNI